MNPKIVIRNETDADATAIAEVTVAAFETLEISNHTEQTIIAALRAANALTVSLVAEMDGRVLGISHFLPWRCPTARRIGTDWGPYRFCPHTSGRGLAGR